MLLFCIFFHVAPRFLDQNLRYDTKICHDLTTTLARSLEVGECQRSRQATWGGRVPTEAAAPKKTNSGGDVGGQLALHRGPRVNPLDGGGVARRLPVGGEDAGRAASRLVAGILWAGRPVNATHEMGRRRGRSLAGTFRRGGKVAAAQCAAMAGRETWTHDAWAAAILAAT